jgi:cell division cycle protein 20 (cofactor of APC complex)
VLSNFYFNPLDWSRQNRIAIALAESAYLLSDGREVAELDRYSNVPVTSVRFLASEDVCLIGESTGRVEVYDNEKGRKVRQINVHYDRVGVLQSAPLTATFLSGSKDRVIKLNDLRLKKADVATWERHRGEVCGLSVSQSYVASGGNDNRVCIWDVRKGECIRELREHRSAVKAVAWCPWRAHLLATGGGNHDRRIILWNGCTDSVEARIDTAAQVVAVTWQLSTRQLVSAHSSARSGFVLVWDGLHPRLRLKGHRGRLLSLCLNPNQPNEACTIAADETLRFWDLSPNNSPHQQRSHRTLRKDALSECDFR